MQYRFAVHLGTLSDSVHYLFVLFELLITDNAVVYGHLVPTGQPYDSVSVHVVAVQLSLKDITSVPDI